MHEMNKEQFGRFIGQQRREKNFTQKQLAERLFISDKAISKWERGLTLVLLCFVFGLYFMFFAKNRLPNYHDENRINAVSDGPFRMNLPGVSINNSNWPHIVQAARIWCCCGGVALGLVNLILMIWFPQLLQSVFVVQGILLLFLLGLFVPMYIAAKRYE